MPEVPAEAPLIIEHPSRIRDISRPFFPHEALPSGHEVSEGIQAPVDHSVSYVLRPPPFLDHLVGGRLRFFSHVWSGITSDQWVLSTVQGFTIDLIADPSSIPAPPTVPLSYAARSQFQRELSDLLQKGAIERAPENRGGVISSIFLVQKNNFVQYRHFKMEGIHLLRDLLLPGDWLAKIDLQDAYLTVPVSPSSRDLLRFLWNGQAWRFTCLPFGLSSAPWCFTKIMRPVVAWLRSRGVRLIVYLDDILIMAQSRALLLRHLHLTVTLVSDLGFIVNQEKSCLTPSRSIEFLGFQVNSEELSLSLPLSKVKAIRKELKHALRLPQMSLRHLARIIGLLASSIQAIFPAPLHYRALQRLKIAHLRSGASYADLVSLDAETTDEMRWWIHNLSVWNGRAIVGPQPDLIIESDASLHGWGAHCSGVSTGGPWSPEESHLHINALELLAGSFAIRSFANGVVSSAIRLRMDNISAVRYVNCMGGTRSVVLTHLAKDFWEFCLDRNISVVAEYLPGLHNTLADWSSRYISDSSDWKLDETVFSAISSLWGPFAVDLFASRLNTQLPRFFSWRPDPLAEAVDALLQHWGGALMYAFPPFALIPRVLLQVRQQLANLVLIVPFWRTQSWFPQILELLVDFPFLLPTQVSLLQGPAGEVHPLLQNGSLRLLACKISGVQEEALDFQEQLGSYWTALGRPGRDGLIEPPGVLGLAGASTGLWIPLRPLSIPS
ncbi:uncharacterized protein LOC122943828 [Bufo gargarizans]|uniref:uncharacterized protein LOC122923935 n=2 Tax=Bufo gargarizans TaxID=30331 RepID=UPI001CF3AB28|nr:uncharacterized protein LOC122923935 [Bufo gargarizans]XP_044137482.1 uncharacterized protein LOC122928573 [Bufo gargarizans]XP_044148988.1 uncharacterized protein LOC122937886 [Bufo gargarizans]XP_044151330.1 uncharacterized protein LOC122939323 [Bufo gargarizans]XP_044157824.1 uncharacterized protein LOC122943828 [Bufo gargarizans]